ncbi:hypothetical protein EsDP_00002692 [Epichloe bromicola]|uniref:Structure-specific endonuclease subunit SLX4 n=1 Tax=Epichloe bromicola TaxID=79588 RepID=A0ABQ0CLJ2_9HYPO
MASPDAFLSSPARRSKQYIVPSSSPDLPSIQDILLQNSRRPAIKCGSKVASIADTATSAFASARDLWKSAQAAEVNQISPSQASDQLIVIDDNDTARDSIEPTSKGKTPPRRQSGSQQFQIEEAAPTTLHPWKRFKPKTPEKDAIKTFENPDSGCLNMMPLATDASLADDANRASSPMQESLLSAQPEAKIWDPKESLQLELAMARRKVWTPPPKQTTTCVELGESPAAAESAELEDGEKTNSFETLLATYKCDDGAADEAVSHQSDGSASKKRKLSGVQYDKALPAPAIPTTRIVAEKKAPRKRPRTLTALATAAYKQATQVENANVAQNTNDASIPNLPQTGQNKAKVKPRKRPTKSKKRIEPPKPILFSPETALKQVAQQDFVFGTSSQLAGEQSPTFLRDLQRAMKSSNQLDQVDLTTPLNSDSIEPLECRPKLWDAAARDADGDLFDVEVINLTEGDSCPAQTLGDPFGYFKGDISLSPQLHSARHSADASKDGDGFTDLSDILPVGSKTLLPAPEINMSRSRSLSPECQGEPRPQASVKLTATSASAPDANHFPRPAFENYTDTQLSKEVCRYGFKPIKRRSAMITLLDQCWQQRMGSSGHHVRMKSTVATASKSTTSSPTKRPRGRPRKSSTNESPAQDPPPSAQVPETPKRPRGRPRKSAEASPSVSKRVSERATPKPVDKKRKATSQNSQVAKLIEIPDSESDLASSLNSSPSSSFSISSPPQQVDLTMSLGEDTELSLAMASTDSESNLFDYITRAVKTAPRTTVAAEPSWHEKILLYDPIVLEDFATWLNSGQLTRVGFDEEINPVDVKKWCESKSICCLWKVNLRGKERKRY